MRRNNIGQIGSLAFLGAVCLAGCGRQQAPAPVAPAVISVVPANGATGVALNTPITATFNTLMNAATINATTFTVTGPGGAVVSGAVTYSGTMGTLTPAAPLAAGSSYAVVISTGAQDAAGNALSNNFLWMFATAGPPRVISTAPAAAATGVAVNVPITATFSTTMNAASITAPGTFTVTGPGATPVAGGVTYTGTTATFTPTNVLTGNVLYTATISTAAKDIAGDALASQFIWTFTTNPPPTVVATVPTSGASSVAIATPVTATFSRAMDATSLTTSTFTVTDPGAAPVAGAVTYNGVTATFTPTTTLAGSTLYTATITTGAKDPTGSPLSSNFVWTFTTSTIPKVTSTNPANGALNVPVNQKITATFTEAMNPATITALGTFTVAATSGGAAVAGAITYDGASRTAIFSPTTNLTANTSYTATVTTAAQSVPGNGLASNYVWSFTAGANPVSNAPFVTFSNPANSDVNVPTNQHVVATFNKPMDPSTISSAGTFTLAVTAGGAAVPGAVSYAGNTAQLTPNNNLAAATQYTATITTAAKDLTGKAMASNFVWSFTTGAGPNAVAPTITLTSPANADVNVPLDAAVSATFSTAMDPMTVQAATFTLVTAGAGGAPIKGTVSYDAVNKIAAFKPSTNLAASTQYTATISNAVTDQSGVPLGPGIRPNPWSFTTGTAVGTGPQAVNLRSASTFGSFGGAAGITNSGINTLINGDIGTTGADTLVTGFHDTAGCIYTETPLNIGAVNGTIFTAPGTPLACGAEANAATFGIATQAASDANTAYLALAAYPGGIDPGAGQLGGLVLAPAVYKAAGGSFQITGSDLTLDAKGDPNAVWVFQTASTLTVGAPGAPRSVILVNGAQAKNVFWQVGSAATINAAGGGTMVGTIIASAGATFSTAGNAAITTLNGRALGLNASVTMVNTVINVPAP
ncbi:MAG: hypothetical protein NVS9B4_02450 [Candidatus Acidiferrum sp.]